MLFESFVVALIFDRLLPVGLQVTEQRILVDYKIVHLVHNQYDVVKDNVAALGHLLVEKG